MIEGPATAMACPMCGGPVVVHAGDEGTSSYTPAAAAALDKARERLVWLRRNLSRPPGGFTRDEVCAWAIVDVDAALAALAEEPKP